MTKCKLIITDAGDFSVGLSAQSWEIECPFSQDWSDEDEFEAFRQAMVNVYEHFCDGRCIAEYDFELKNRDTDGE